MEFKKMCQCLPEVYQVGLIALYFVLAYVVYRIFLFGFQKFARKSAIISSVIESSRKPFLLVLLELALYWSLDFFKFPDGLEQVTDGAVFVLTAITIGWFSARIAQGIFHHHQNKFDQTGDGSLLTQAVFLYRAAMIVIVLLTLASLLLIFPHIKNIGFGILGSAGIAGIAIGMAAKPVLQNLIAGFMLAFMKTIKIGDRIYLEDTYGHVESICMTHVVVRTWDLKRLILPVSNFIEKTFLSADLVNSELIGTVFLYCDYTTPVSVVREKCKELIESHPLYTGKTMKIHVTDFREQTMQIRILMSAKDAVDTFELCAFVREKLMEFLQKEYKNCLPCQRFKNFATHAESL